MAGLAPGRPRPRNGSADLLPLTAERSFLARQQARLPPSSARAAALKGAGRPARRLKTAIEAAWGGSEKQSGKTTMAQIGTFTRGDDGSFNGAIRTLNISVKATRGRDAFRRIRDADPALRDACFKS